MPVRGDPDAAGREERFEALYVANYHSILGYALRRLGAGDAADVVAETFLTTWRRLPEVPAGDEARLWLYGTARRVIANQERSRRRRLRLAARLIGHTDRESAAPDPPGEAAAALAALAPLEREAILLTIWEGLSPAEVARVVGCSPGAVRVRLHRARRKIARELEASRDRRPRPATALRTEEMS